MGVLSTDDQVLPPPIFI